MAYCQRCGHSPMSAEHTFGEHEYVPPPPSFRCPVCKMVSYNPNDVREGYCGNCHAFTGKRDA